MEELFTTYFEEFNALFNIAIAMLLGGIIGWDREKANKAAGIRTMMIVSGGAAFLISLGPFLIKDIDEGVTQNLISADPMRLVEAVITGISFLGAGTIIRSRSGMKVEGITTAASLLFAAAIGIATATEKYIIAVGATVLALIVLIIFNKIVKTTDIKSDNNRENNDDDQDNKSFI